VDRYAPDENSFFFGDDPVNLLRQLQDIRQLENCESRFLEERL